MNNPFPVLLNYFLLHSKLYFLCTCVGVHTAYHKCGGPRATFASSFSPPTMWILGIKSGSEALAADALHVEPSQSPCCLFLKATFKESTMAPSSLEDPRGSSSQFLPQTVPQSVTLTQEGTMAY